MAAPTTNLDRTQTVTLANPTPPTNSVVTYQGTPPTPQGLAPAVIAAPDAVTPWSIADPLNGATAPELAGKAEADGTEVTTSSANGRVTGHSVLGNWTENPTTDHPSSGGGQVIPSGFPNASTTGVQSGITLTAYAGPTNIIIDGTLVENKIISGNTRINANNVTIRNCRLQGFNLWGVIVETGLNTHIEHCEFNGIGTLGTSALGIGGGTASVTYCNIYGMTLGIQLFGICEVRENYIHDLDSTSSDPADRHFDGITCFGGQDGSVIDHNTINVRGGTACVFITSQNSAIHNIIVNNNLLIGASAVDVPSYTVYSEVVSFVISGIQFTNNIIQQGIFGYHNVVGNSVVWTNNRDYVTDALIPPPAAVSPITQAGTTLQFSVGTTANSGLVSNTITVPADAQIAIVAVSCFDTVPNVHSGGVVTLTKGGTGTAMTSAGAGGDASGSAWQCAMWYLVLPDTGTNKTLIYDWAGSAVVAEQAHNFSITFWKGINTASAVRSGGGAQRGASGFPVTTPTLTAVSGDLIVAFAAGYCAAGNGSGSINSWTGLVEVGEVPNTLSAEGAWAVGYPSGNTTVAAATGSNLTEPAIMAVVLKPTP